MVKIRVRGHLWGTFLNVTMAIMGAGSIALLFGFD